MKKIVISCIAIIMLIVAIYSSSSIVEAREIESCSKGMVVLEGNTNTVLYEKNKDLRLPMASTTKIATCIVAIENCNNLDEKFVVSDKAVGIEGTSIYIKSGELLSMRELLYGLMLASGNDCAVAIAERLGGEEEFLEKMNSMCADLGLTNTNFENPHGLDSDNHYTSAYDLARITSYALQNDVFREIASTERMVIDSTDKYQARYLKHKNKLLFTDDNCIGVKTGFTDNAGRCLVNAHEENGMQIISVVLNCQPMFDECARLTALALDNYIMKEFIKPYNYVSDITVDDSDKLDIGIITVEGYKLPILKYEENLYEVRYDFPNQITAPVKLNEKVGEVTVYYKGDLIYKSDLITIESAESNDIKYLFDNILDKWF